MQHLPEKPAGFSLASIGLGLSDWFERWFPDAYALALSACVIVFAASLASGASAAETAQWFGAGFWDLVAFTMQIAMIIVTGYAVAVSPPVSAVIRRMAGVPRNGKSAAAFVGLFSMLSSLVSWSFSLIFSGLLAREVAHRVAGFDALARRRATASASNPPPSPARALRPGTPAEAKLDLARFASRHFCFSTGPTTAVRGCDVVPSRW